MVSQSLSAQTNTSLDENKGIFGVELSKQKDLTDIIQSTFHRKIRSTTTDSNSIKPKQDFVALLPIVS